MPTSVAIMTSETTGTAMPCTGTTTASLRVKMMNIAISTEGMITTMRTARTTSNPNMISITSTMKT